MTEKYTAEITQEQLGVITSALNPVATFGLKESDRMVYASSLDRARIEWASIIKTLVVPV